MPGLIDSERLYGDFWEIFVWVKEPWNTPKFKGYASRGDGEMAHFREAAASASFNHTSKVLTDVKYTLD